MQGKNIVLLSDGTGNTGGKGRGTNVWKLYRAVDVHTASRPQILFYDDGVGTGHFRPLRLLGGACGYGLSQNIRELYTFLVSNYDPGDQIYLFGFSRGAFTVRALAGLICRCGIIDRRRYFGSQLDRRVAEAMRIYKRCRRPEAWPEGQRFCRQHGVAQPGAGDSEAVGDVPIKLIGVWDTVDAIGLPVDELTDALDKIKPFRFPNCGLLPCVEHSYQALSIDDERLTFHPILWNEQTKRDEQIVEQVWFSGVHSNVGGGYLKDQMALVSLTWMIDRAKAAGLELNEDLCAEYRTEASVHALLYDSRAGLSSYYRYRPREIQALCEEGGAGTPRIHWTVLDRIRRATANYAPALIPEDYELVDAPEELREELEERDRTGRGRLLETAWDLIWWRKLLYFGFVWLTLIAIGVGHALSDGGPDPCRPCETTEACESANCLLVPLNALFDLAIWAAPAALEGWLSAFRLHPGWLAAFALATALMLMLRTRLRRLTVDSCLAAWRQTLPPPGTGPRQGAPGTGPQQGAPGAEPKRPGYLRLASLIRRSSIQNSFTTFQEKILPKLVIAGAAVLILGLLGTWIWELCLTPPPPAPHECGSTAVPQTLEQGDSRSFTFDTRCPKAGSNVILEAGARYSVAVEVGEVPWQDENFAASPAGLNSTDAGRLRYRAARPLKRSFGPEWFELLGQIDGCSDSRFSIGAGPTELEARRTGRLVAYVNDVTCHWCLDRWRFYANNKGTAEITIVRLPDPADRGR